MSFLLLISIIKSVVKVMVNIMAANVCISALASKSQRLHHFITASKWQYPHLQRIASIAGIALVYGDFIYLPNVCYVTNAPVQLQYQ
jgi:hypothetical protein